MMMNGADQGVWQRLEFVPRYPLIGTLTPLQRLTKLSAVLVGPEIYFKRDDLIGFGLGGNKIRGLELLAADALAQRANVLVTGAGPQSNHVRATAAVAAHLGLQCRAVFWGCPPPCIDGNFRLTKMLGAQPVFTGDAERSSVDNGITVQCEILSAQGLKPYAIPRGGACALGALGHVLAARELHWQCAELGLMPKIIVLATGSGGTHAGWLMGTRALGDPWQIQSVTVSRPASDVRQEIVRIANAAAELLQADCRFVLNDVIVHEGFIGAGYGVPSPEAANAIRLIGRNEGILLDPTYTGKAMAGLLALIASGNVDGPQVFIHTGGEPAFFAGDGKWLL